MIDTSNRNVGPYQVIFMEFHENNNPSGYFLIYKKNIKHKRLYSVLKEPESRAHSFFIKLIFENQHDYINESISNIICRQKC